MGKSYNLKASAKQKDHVYDNAAFNDPQQNGHYRVMIQILPHRNLTLIRVFPKWISLNSANSVNYNNMQKQYGYQ